MLSDENVNIGDVEKVESFLLEIVKSIEAATEDDKESFRSLFLSKKGSNSANLFEEANVERYSIYNWKVCI